MDNIIPTELRTKKPKKQFKSSLAETPGFLSKARTNGENDLKEELKED